MSGIPCFHCGEPVSVAGEITLEVDGHQQSFCCLGCRSVCDLIQSEGLENFYQHRTTPAITPKPLGRTERERLELLDHELVQQSFVIDTPEGREAQLMVSGITCAACIWLLERHLEKLPGVISFSINHSTQRARLLWDSAQVNLSALLIAVSELGYRARPYEAGEHEEALHKEKKQALIRLCVAGIGTVQTMMLAMPLYFEVISGLSEEFIQVFRWFSLLVATPVVFYSAKPFFTNAVRDIRSRHLTMDVPVAVAIGFAYLASGWVTLFGGDEVYFESVCMFTFFLSLGRYVEMQARYKAGLTGSALVTLQPAVATQQTPDGLTLVPSHQLKPGDLVLVKPGDTVPVDGIITAGHSTLNEAALTGEYLPESREPGDQVHAGGINGESPLTVRVEKAGADTRLSGIMRVLDRVQAEKPKVARMADRIAKLFVSRVLIIAPLVWIGWRLAGADNAFDIMLSVLVVTCPCALSLATPTAITSATMYLRQLGFLPTRGHTLESLATVDTVVFDKTGTLTRGELALRQVQAFNGWSKEACLQLAAGLENHSEHPIAKVFQDADSPALPQVISHTGGGLTGDVNGQRAVIGHQAFVEEQTGTQAPPHASMDGITVWLALGQQWLACFELDDEPRPEAKAAIQQLHDMGIRTLLLSGDRSAHVQRIAAATGVGEAIGQASPEDKLARIQALEAEGRSIMMVGDGLNDLPSMAGAKVSVAMGNAADLTQLRADGVLLNGQLTQLIEAIHTSQRTRRIIRQNMYWALGYNLSALPAAAAGLVPPWLAAIGMSLSSLIVVLNALRLSKPGTPATISPQPQTT
ncbi:MAG: cadmium-translocating P-type ATPase [Marinobacter sp.]|nr:cadmium-translocating P-type ATPase [Marinobacter sp.]